MNAGCSRFPLSKNGDTKHTPLNDEAVAALKAAKAFSNGQPWVFLNRSGERLVNPRGWFEPALKAGGITGFRWHDLRHTFASRLVMAGVDLRTVQVLMGHKTIQMMCRYAHLAPQHELAAVQRLCDTTPGAARGGAAQKEATDTTTAPGPRKP